SANGSISPSQEVVLKSDEQQVYTFSADAGYKLAEVKVNNTVVTVTNNQYTVSNISADTQIQASFVVDDTNGLEPCAAPYDSTQTYVKDNVASYQNYNWTAKWWTKGATPVDKPWGNPWRKHDKGCK
ncbi:MAG: hypothetical protein GY787_01545, partial [Alteromonadales bacterium]|nr:hypothetical protein [Alteromonadales bacterium]